jgi:hypothetical protein
VSAHNPDCMDPAAGHHTDGCPAIAPAALDLDLIRRGDAIEAVKKAEPLWFTVAMLDAIRAVPKVTPTSGTIGSLEEARRRVARASDALALAGFEYDAARAAMSAFSATAPRPRIVCLCGSTRFIPTWNEWRKRLTEQGEIVLAIEVVTSQSATTDPQVVAPELKARLDELHKRKIDLADYVLVLDVGGYVGASTRSEIEYARAHGKPVQFLSEIAAPLAAQPEEPKT